MDFDDIVIGSGLSALGTVIGLPANRRILVMGGPKQGVFSYYDVRQSVPTSYVGDGGLGNYWHGAIPTALRNSATRAAGSEFVKQFKRFYPATGVESRPHEPWLFVPWRTNGPRMELARLDERGVGRSTVKPAYVKHGEIQSAVVRGHSDFGTLRCLRLWIAASAQNVPRLLNWTLEQPVSRGLASDYSMVLLGRVVGVPEPLFERARDSVFVEASYPQGHAGLCSRRPTHFEFKQLDQGIEARVSIGLSTGNAIAMIVRQHFPGLLSESLHSHTGHFARARVLSVYAQVLMGDANKFNAQDGTMLNRQHAQRAAIDQGREGCKVRRLIASRRTEFSLLAIHLHHSLDLSALEAQGVNTAGASFQVVDASAHARTESGCPSQKMMMAARECASSLS